MCIHVRVQLHLRLFCQTEFFLHKILLYNPTFMMLVQLWSHFIPRQESIERKKTTTVVHHDLHKALDIMLKIELFNHITSPQDGTLLDKQGCLVIKLCSQNCEPCQNTCIANRQMIDFQITSSLHERIAHLNVVEKQWSKSRAKIFIALS